MRMIDSHAHLFLEEFDHDRAEVIQRAKEAGVTHIFMPNIDSTSVGRLLDMCEAYPGYCFPMAGLHPTSVEAGTYQRELELVAEQLASEVGYVAVGEIGLDLYWDKTYLKEQMQVFDRQIQWALEYHLPVVIHCREAFAEMMEVMQPYKNVGLSGIFHSFTGTAEEAALLMEYDRFMLGINGVVTFKKSGLPDVLPAVPLSRLVLETDSPYLTPVPNRGKRNESACLRDTLLKVAEVYGKSPEYVADITSGNALCVFNLMNKVE